MRAVNLLPRDTKLGDRTVNVPAVVGAGMGVVVVAALVGGFVLESSKVSSAQRALDQAKQELASTPLPPAGAPKPAPTAPAVTATEQPLLQAVSSAIAQRIAWDRILGEFSRVVPSDVWLNSLTLTTPAPGTTSNGVTLSGTTYSYDSVARLLSRLSLVPDLNSVTLASTTRSGRLVQFSVNAGVNGAPAPPAAATTTTTATTATTP